MKSRRIMALCLTVCMSIFVFAGCESKGKRADFSGINTVCELATLRCYYHNVAKGETEASGMFKFLGVGYKKIWIEYSGIVEIGIDVSKVTISDPDKNGVVQVTIPDAKVLNVRPDEKSISKPLVDTGFLTKITKEEEIAALAAAQEDMEETAKSNTSLLLQAKERAKKTIEGYIKNVGQQIGKDYTVEWKDIE